MWLDVTCSDKRQLLRWLLATVYATAGVLHLSWPAPLVAITPHWIPFPEAVILITGLLEILGAGALLTTRLRYPAAVALAFYAICVYPANIQHAIQDISSGTGLGWFYHAPRLALQPVIVWAALYAGNVIDWTPARL